MKQETLRRLISEYMTADGADLPLYVSSLVEQERVLREKIADIRRDENAELRRHELAMDAIDKARRNLQAECPHHESTYHSDPAGGSDSCEPCDLCGKHLR